MKNTDIDHLYYNGLNLIYSTTQAYHGPLVHPKPSHKFYTKQEKDIYYTEYSGLTPHPILFILGYGCAIHADFAKCFHKLRKEFGKHDFETCRAALLDFFI